MYEEEKIADYCTFYNDSVSVDRDAGYRPIEIVVSMTKMLHLRLLPAVAGRWIFTRLNLNRMFQLADTSTLSVVLRDKLYGRLTRSEIRADVSLIGSIYFSLVRT